MSPTNIYAIPAVRVLLAHEIAAIAPILSGIYGQYGLFLQPHAHSSQPLPAHLLNSMIKLHTDAPRVLGGQLRCGSAELPFANESFKLVIAQHWFESVHAPDVSAAELARVLAPEGVALVLGFNPLSLWRPWLGQRREPGALRITGARACQNALGRSDIDTLQVRYLGSAWPRAGRYPAAPTGANPISNLLSRFAGSWLLLARKRRSALTPLRLRLPVRDLALSPRLAPGAHRWRA